MIYLKTSIGVELRGEDLLIASLQSNYAGAVFTHYKRIPNYRIRDKEEVRREIDLFFKSNGLDRNSIVLGLPRRDIVMRHLDFPAEVADNLKQVVRYQVQSFEPTEEDRFYFDYSLLNGRASKKKLRILLAMVRKASLDEHLQLLLDLGIRPITVTGSSFALSNILLQNRKDLQDKTCMLADLTSSGMELLALRQGALVYSREAQKEEEQSWADFMLREIDEAASNIRLEPEDTLETIILTGESSESAYEELKASLPDCELLRKSVHFTMTGENESRFQEAAAALGLAHTGMVRSPSIKLNLLPAALRIHQARWAYIPAVISGLAIIALLIALSFHRMVQERILIRQLDQEIESLKITVEKVQAIRNEADAVEKRILSIRELIEKRDRNLEILRELTTILPSDTFLTVYSYRDGTVQLNGSSGSAPDLIPMLEKSPLLKDVVMKGPMFKDAQTGKDRFNFEAKLE